MEGSALEDWAEIVRATVTWKRLPSPSAIVWEYETRQSRYVIEDDGSARAEGRWWLVVERLPPPPGNKKPNHRERRKARRHPEQQRPSPPRTYTVPCPSVDAAQWLAAKDAFTGDGSEIAQKHQERPDRAEL